MSLKQFILLSILTAAGGLTGGAVVSRVFQPQEALASTTGLTIRAENLIIQDENGKMRAGIVQMDDGSVIFSMFDKAQKPRVRMSVAENGSPQIELADVSSKRLAWLALTEGGSPLFGMFDQTGESRTVIYLEENGLPRLFLADETGNSRFSIILSEDGSPCLLMKNQNQTPAVAIDTEGFPRIMMCHNSSLRAAFGLSEDGSAGLYMSDKAGNLLWSAP